MLVQEVLVILVLQVRQKVILVLWDLLVQKVMLGIKVLLDTLHQLDLLDQLDILRQLDILHQLVSKDQLDIRGPQELEQQGIKDQKVSKAQ